MGIAVETALSLDLERIDWDGLVREADALFRELFPICRSLTGEGNRQTLRRLQEVVDFAVKEIPSGTVVYDWVVPQEWNIRDAYIKDSKGNKIVDFQVTNLHVVNYSEPVDRVVTFDELDKHLHSLPEMPDAIPYRTTYYNRNWGFCLTYNQYCGLDRSEEYHVYIDSTLADGSLTYGEGVVRGDSGQEYVISTYCCHPSLANDNLSGPILWALLFRELSRIKTHHSYRFVIVPETVGAIAYLSENEQAMRQVDGGFIPTTVAGPGRFGYKQSYQLNHLVDRVVKRTFEELGVSYHLYPFDINGSDESHYSAPAFRIPIGTISKDKYYEFDYYHTSLDNLDFAGADHLVQTLKLYLLAIEKMEINRTYRSLNPWCEPMLGKRDLYPKVGGSIKQRAADFKQAHLKREYQISTGTTSCGSELDAIRWVMFYSDGRTPLLDIAEKTDIPMRQLHEVSLKLVDHGLLAVEGSMGGERGGER